MAKRIYPTYWEQWIGKFAIKCGNDLHQPCVVYVTGVNQYRSLVMKTPNTGFITYAKPWQLVEYSPRLFVRLEAAWLLRSARNTVNHQTKRLLSGK
jgi:hypothetical protein